MIRIDDNMLKQLGLGKLPAARRDALLEAFYEELQLRVGTELSDRFDEEQLLEFSRLVEADDLTAANAFLDTQAPDREEVVRREYARLRETVGEAAPRLLCAADVAERAATAATSISRPRPSVGIQSPSPANLGMRRSDVVDSSSLRRSRGASS